MKTIKHLSVLGLLLVTTLQASAQLEIEFNKELKKYSISLVEEFDEISEERKENLEEVGDFLVTKLKEGQSYGALFVCTHNSRRSHLSDIWFKQAMLFYGVNGLESYSGGTEATAFNKNAIEALERAGFTTHYNTDVENPVVSVAPGKFPVWRVKSKVYTHRTNPTSNFTAIMVCSDADKSCPVVPGADGRFALPYNDPRYYDGTPAQDLKYDQASREIGCEMFYLADHIKSQLIKQMEVTKR